MKFPTIASLHEHAIGVHSLSRFIQAKAKENVFCAQCSLAFPNSIAYAEHFLLFHASERKPFNVSLKLIAPQFRINPHFEIQLKLSIIAINR